MSSFRENGQKSQKSGRAMFLTFFTSNFVPSFGKILRAVSEIIRETHKHTDKPDFIGPFRFSTGDQKQIGHKNNSFKSFLFLKILGYRIPGWLKGGRTIFAHSRKI